MSRTIKIDKQNFGITWTGAWTGLAGGNEVQLENAKNLGYASGTFGDNVGAGLSLANGAGAGKVNLKSGVDFTWDSKLNATGGSDVDIYDDNASGAFTASHYMRIVNNAKNITDVTGCNITNIYAKNLTGSSTIWSSPPGTDAYIDPEQGRFCLPRPNLWCKMESGGDCVSPSIYNVAPSYTNFSFVGGKWGNCAYYLGTWIGCGWNQQWHVKCTYDLNYNIPSKGTASFWYYLGMSGNIPSLGSAAVTIGSDFTVPDNSFGARGSTSGWSVGIQCWYPLGGAEYYHFFIDTGGTYTSIDIGGGGFYHIYVVWDYAKGLTGGKSIRAFINGTEISTSANLPAATALKATATAGVGYWLFGPGYWGYGDVYLDNLKVWNSVVEESPTWEYNAGTGREDALHYMYGSGNGYKPQITGTNNGVGYFFVTSSTTPATSSGSGGDETETLKASATTNAAGSFGDSGVLCDNVFESLSSTTHYNYGKRVDASAVEDPADGFGAVAGGITDILSSGALLPNKYIRLVANAFNIKDINYPTAGAGGLKVFAYNINGINKAGWNSPPKDRVYVDPVTGQYIFPRPQYWSKCETLVNMITSPEIYNGSYPPSTWTDNLGTYTETFPAGKFGNCWHGWAASGGAGTESRVWRTISLDSTTRNWNKGTASYWSYLNVVNPAQALWGVATRFLLEPLFFGNTSIEYIHDDVFANNHVHLYISNILIASAVIARDLWVHLYIVWDRAKGLTGGKSVRVFANGVEIISVSNDLPDLSAGQPSYYMYAGHAPFGGVPNAVQVNTYIDNVKVWNEIVSEDPSWEYNAGAGREDALHYIYGAAVNYRPDLAAASSGVGYFRGGASTRQCIITI